MSIIVVSHGLSARPDSVWFPTFRAALTGGGHDVIIPELPDTDSPERDAWRKALAEAVPGRPEDTILVGHSIGAVNVLRLLESHDPAAGVFAGAVLVSASAHEVGYELLASFFEGGFDWARIRAAAKGFHVLQAIDDPVNAPEPLEHVGIFVRELGAVATVLPAGGHLGAYPEDHIELPEAVELVQGFVAAG
ncbi:alpha/beta fold hydrolase [Nocardia sp. CDC153]|uniref:RBBP9/YdeN family alpha/beta hydrolase n=1 Tax=Nocardia sp. CDC153 TaxID=3112167 RepID=UPI002DB76DFA|nr:alpha/beta fold hydrolase [Nocardia sp. CDC153]MEC3954636.1 alpha/beta fold hydrolase [Nocardia sp. CDC153]